MKLYAHRCNKEGTEFISIQDSLTCPDCGDKCEKVEEGDTREQTADIAVYIVESGLVRVQTVEGKKVVKKVKRKLSCCSKSVSEQEEVDEAKKVVYVDGKKVVRTIRKKVPATAAQRAAAANARKYAHTSEADHKRKKSMQARKDDKALGI